MKRITLTFLALISFTFLVIVGCDLDDSEKKENIDKFFGGEHKLQRMISENTFSASGSFFLFSGGFSAESKTTVSFSWQSFDSIYNFTTLDLSQLRVKIVDGKKPIIKFDCYYFYIWEYPKDIKYNYRWIRMATVECDSKYWKPNIELPLNE